MEQSTRNKPRGGLLRRAIPAAVLLTLIALLAGVCCKTVPTGYTGILTTFGRVEDSNLDAGFHLKAPWQNPCLLPECL